MKIEDPRKVREAFEAAQGKATIGRHQGSKISDALQVIKLPTGMRWLDNTNLQLDGGSWVTFIIHPVGTDDWGVAAVNRGGYYVKSLRFGWLTESSSPAHILERVEGAVHAFKREIAAGTAKVVKDGDLLPGDDCAFGKS